MSGNSVIDAIDLFLLPLWFLVFVLLLVIPTAAIVGHRIGKRALRRQKQLPVQERTQPSDTTIGAFLALLGLLLAFTYSFALSRYEDRKEALLLEANAISTAFVQAMLIEEPGRTEYREAVLKYAETRTFGQSMNSNSAALSEQVKLSLERQAALTQMLVRALETQASPAIRASLTKGLTDVLDAHTIRLEAGTQSIPQSLKYLLAAVAVFAVFMVAHNAGIRGRPLTWRTMAFSGLLIVVLLQILDLERPAEGLVTVPQTVMEITVQGMRSDLVSVQPSLQ